MIRATLHFLGYFIFFLLVVALLLPNLFNHREGPEFSGEHRINGNYILELSPDSARVFVTDFYDRGSLTTYLLGQHHRELWKTPVTLPLFDQHLDTITFDIEKLGGGQQTTSFKLLDSYGRNFTLRSVNKDQANAVRPWLKKTGVRILFRDQASALQPYGAPVVADLANNAGIPNTSPKLVFVPRTPAIPDEFEAFLTNRVMLLEVEPNHSWDNQTFIGEHNEVLSSKKVMEKWMAGKIEVDVQAYAYCRLFDVLVGDWDRHAKQWKWLVDTTTRVARPFPVDRDMAFYKFNDGVINRWALHANNKFQSFDPEFDDISGYFKNGQELDSLFFPMVTERMYHENVERLQTRLSPEVIAQAFKHLPPEIYAKIGIDHATILHLRLLNLTEVTSFLSNNYNNASNKLHSK